MKNYVDPCWPITAQFFDGLKRQDSELIYKKRQCLKTLIKGYVKKAYVQKKWFLNNHYFWFLLILVDAS